MDQAHKPLKVLICGAGSVAGRGLVEVLAQRGHEVLTYSAGPVGRSGSLVTGPLDKMHENPHLVQPLDALINFAVLKDEALPANIAFLDSVLAVCRKLRVPHLLHTTTPSVFKAHVSHATEASEVETDPAKKGSYGGLKVATEQHVLKNLPEGTKLSLVVPGHVLGSGMFNPIVGMAFKMPNNKILMLGSGANNLACIDRRVLHQAIARLLETSPGPSGQRYMILDGNAPTRREWLDACCSELGAGTGVVSLPVFLWRTMGLGGELVARVLGMKIRPNNIIGNACRNQTFESNATQKLLGMSFATDWKSLLVSSFEAQDVNFQLPYRQCAIAPLKARNVAFVGYGGIVKQKHLPALKATQFNGTLQAFDLAARTDADTGQKIEPLPANSTLPATDLIVIATPGPAHVAAIPLIEKSNAPVLLEKPLCYNDQELDAFLAAAGKHPRGIYVCHNYRYKENVARMVEHLQRHKPGRLIQADVVFQSPSVSQDKPHWRRDERKARTLFLEYGVHFLDLACMFSTKDWTVGDASYQLNLSGHTCCIQGQLACPGYRVNFMFRQGFIPRRAQVVFTFQNYTAHVGFFPDSFTPQHTGDGSGLWGLMKKDAGKATRRKILDKLTGKDSDQSHPMTYLAACNGGDLGQGIRVEALASFYRAVFELDRRVYGK